MYGYVYKTTNIVNGKIYIGQHRSEKVDPNYYGSGVLIRKSIDKYGIKNFIVELIESSTSKEDLNNKERYWIENYNSRDKSIGYNITIGGESTLGYTFTEEVKKKMSYKAKNRPHPPTTKNRIYVHKDEINKCIKKESLDEYLSNGYVVGKFIKTKQKPWNKGLTAEVDERVKNYSDKRNKIFRSGKSIGFCGLKEDNVNRKKFLQKLYSIDKEEFINNYTSRGKCYCLSIYHFSSNKWLEICKHFNILESNNKTWKNHGKSLLKNKDNHESNSQREKDAETIESIN